MVDLGGAILSLGLKHQPLNIECSEPQPQLSLLVAPHYFLKSTAILAGAGIQAS